MSLDSSENCPVCGFSGRTAFHFGGSSCTACASFFRRTVSLNIRYVCKRDNDCIRSPELRMVCRACRYSNCLAKACFDRDLVQPRKTDKKTPKYILDLRKDGGKCAEVIRDYTTNSYRTIHECRPDGNQEEEEERGFSKILNITHQNLLDYYVKQIQMGMSRCVQNDLLIMSPEDLRKQFPSQVEMALELTSTCPGTDLLEKEDLSILFKYCIFVTSWMDIAWISSTSTLLEKPQSIGPITQIRKTIETVLSKLKLSIAEYSALKSMCIWKLGVLDMTVSLKIVAQEHYLGVTSALRKYYERIHKMEPYEIATRIAEITLQIAPLFTAFQEMVKLYESVGVSLTCHIFEDC